ncbi:MAG: DUF1549 domain-containing protein, partial [Pirellulaceae bacterium]|nr:DUF1549 domain-containing protein [Pirellulaceae bacterium]
KGEELSLENLPFNAQPKQLEVTPDVPKPTRVAVRLSDAEVAAAVDAQFEKLWQSQQLDVKPSVAREEVLVRMSAVLVDQPASETIEPTAAVAEKLVRTATFAEHWADRIAEYWLRGTSAADRQDAAGQALRSYLAQQIVARRPWNEVVADLINSPPDQPSSAFLASLAGGDNHRLAGRVGSALLDEALACARCHDASDNGRVISMDQDEYWSLVALFTGVDGQAAKVAAAKADEEQSGSPKAHRILLDKQPQLFAEGKSPGVFFDRPDGRLQAAGFRLPGGDNWRTLGGVRTPRESLARWMATTAVTDQAAVNLAWRLVFGRPLVAQHATLDGEGLTERREILITLSEQFQAHDRDMARLVSWLVTTRPFALQGLDVDRTRWLVANEVEIDRWNKTATNFAAFVPTQVQRLPTLELALASVDRWSDSRDQRRATLAQPTPDMVKIKTPTVKPELEPSATYLIRSLQPTPAQSEFIDRLVASKLSWIQQVDHIAGLVGESAGNARLHRAAQQILEAKNGDRSAALFQLLQGALLCHESL